MRCIARGGDSQSGAAPVRVAVIMQAFFRRDRLMRAGVSGSASLTGFRVQLVSHGVGGSWGRMAWFGAAGRSLTFYFHVLILLEGLAIFRSVYRGRLDLVFCR